MGVLVMSVGCCAERLFFAGDTAQSITHGVDFRFEEARSCMHKLSDGQQRLSRVTVLNRSLRSHDGILQVGNEVLQRLFALFPKSNDNVSDFVGLSLGPQPALLSDVSDAALLRLCRQYPKLRLLAWDECVDTLNARLSAVDEEQDQKEGCGDGEGQGGAGAEGEVLVGTTAQASSRAPVLVYGIRQVKGLEFRDVAVVDFFSCRGMPAGSHPLDGKHKAWKSLLSACAGPAAAASASASATSGHSTTLQALTSTSSSAAAAAAGLSSELELQLKVLYTAITRSSSHLIFAERQVSVASAAWFALLLERGLAQTYTHADADAQEACAPSTATATATASAARAAPAVSDSADVLAASSSSGSKLPPSSCRGTLMLPDDWTQEGVSLAALAEEDDSDTGTSGIGSSSSVRLLRLAVQCFSSAGDAAAHFLHKAQHHLQAAEFSVQVRQRERQEGRRESSREREGQGKGGRVHTEEGSSGDAVGAVGAVGAVAMGEVEAWAAAAADHFVQAGMFAEAATLCHEYCRRERLCKLSLRIRALS
mmetsp:Transcript_30084/g.68321  ORF Transcript_30084/g.68321 Transcript_30084/m.68321 type:complete len:538 (-) Transcript_30084:464-2077(-)